MLCDDLERWNVSGKGENFKKEISVYIWLIHHFVVQQKPTEQCKTIILQ